MTIDPSIKLIPYFSGLIYTMEPSVIQNNYTIEQSLRVQLGTSAYSSTIGSNHRVNLIIAPLRSLLIC